MSTGEKLSKVEYIKVEGDHLRGRIAEELAGDATHFSEESVQLLKFHGMYQQDDRDLRQQLKKAGQDRHYMMMIRARIPGGSLSGESYLAFDRLADQYGNGTLRITTRQTFQMHGVLKSDLRKTIRGINETLVTTLGGCGDQVRNIIMCPEPKKGPFYDELRALLLALVDELSARTGAYHEIWLDGEKVNPRDFEDERPEVGGPDHTAPDAEEPLYGRAYLPRKFKLAVAIEGDNCVDVYANDLGIVAHRDKDRVAGFTLLVGGGMGRTASKEDTYPRLASAVAFVRPEELVETARAIVTIQRDHGNRVDRRYARFKYLLDRRGLEWFRGELESRLGRKLTPPRELTWENTDDHLGWHDQGDGRYYLGLFVQNGRIHDVPGMRLKSALRAIVIRHQPTIRLTCQQNLLVADLPEGARADIEATLREAGVALVEDVPAVVRNAMACPALPTCGLATAESERVMPGLLQDMDALLREIGLADEPVVMRMTGCPNGCARPYVADIGFVGRSAGKYDIFLGGDIEGTHLNTLYRELVPFTALVETLEPVLRQFRAGRQPGERFGPWCRRTGVAQHAPADVR